MIIAHKRYFEWQKVRIFLQPSQIDILSKIQNLQNQEEHHEGKLSRKSILNFLKHFNIE